MPMFFRAKLWAIAAACSVLACFSLVQAPPAAAKINKIMQMRLGKLHPIFLPELPTPAGWIVEQAASEANKLSMLVPAGTDFSTAEALIYGVAYYNEERTAIEDRARTSNDKWLASVADAEIVPLPDVARTRGGAAFKVFQYHNPNDTQQSDEIVAFGEDTDEEGNLYGVQVVISARNEAALSRHRATFLKVLADY